MIKFPKIAFAPSVIAAMIMSNSIYGEPLKELHYGEICSILTREVIMFRLGREKKNWEWNCRNSIFWPQEKYIA